MRDLNFVFRDVTIFAKSKNAANSFQLILHSPRVPLRYTPGYDISSLQDFSQGLF